MSAALSKSPAAIASSKASCIRIFCSQHTYQSMFKLAGNNCYLERVRSKQTNFRTRESIISDQILGQVFHFLLNSVCVRMTILWVQIGRRSMRASTPVPSKKSSVHTRRTHLAASMNSEAATASWRDCFTSSISSNASSSKHDILAWLVLTANKYQQKFLKYAPFNSSRTLSSSAAAAAAAAFNAAS